MSKRVVVRKTKKNVLKTLKKHHFIFKTLSNVNKKRRNLILKNAPLSLYTAIKILFRNLVSGKIVLKPQHKKRLSKSHKTLIRTNSKLNNKDIKRNMIQSGNGLSQILKIVLPILGSVITSVI